jgi:hypothetical protein
MMLLCDSGLDVGTKAPISKNASHHGDLRRKQGYTVAMAVKESRLLQISIFTMLHKNVTKLDLDFQHAPSQRCDHCERGGCTIEAATAVLYGRVEDGADSLSAQTLLPD